MRSLATRQSNLALSKYVADAIQVIKAAKYYIFWKLPVLVNQIRR
jgi:methylmalonyl-CoA mutase